MGDAIQQFLFVGAITYTTTEVIKACIRLFFKRARVGVLISLVINSLFVLAIGEGLAARALEFKYSSMAIPELFKYVDIFTTATVLCLVSKGVDSFIDIKRNPYINETNPSAGTVLTEPSTPEVLAISHMDGSPKYTMSSWYSETAYDVANSLEIDQAIRSLNDEPVDNFDTSPAVPIDHVPKKDEEKSEISTNDIDHEVEIESRR